MSFLNDYSKELDEAFEIQEINVRKCFDRRKNGIE